MRVAGIMSGTSLDGIDVAVVEIRGRGRVETIGFTSTPYSANIREEILAVSNTNTHTAAISRLHYKLGDLYAAAVNRAVKKFGPVELIGCHGQTIFHEGRSNTIQLGEPSVLAERTGVAVVSNFRARDIAAGGQGAPLVPFVDYLLFRHPRRTRVSLNIGGIGNITVIPANARPDQILGFDTGPGNMVMDALVKELSGGKLTFDRDGRLARQGKLNQELLRELLSDRYYRAAPPKSAGREQYGAGFVARMKKSGLPATDLIATATALTAVTIAHAVHRYAGQASELIAAGGGVHNPEIMNHLRALLPGVLVSTTAEHGIHPDAKEAIAFALLAYETWHGRPGNLPSATGARRAVILGNITPGAGVVPVARSAARPPAGRSA